MMRRVLLPLLLFIWIAGFACLANVARADEYGFRLGPVAPGNGGANPISIPPLNILDYEFYYLDQSQWEIDASISPGLFFGYRAHVTEGLYAAGGPGLVINANGSGVGVFAALGYVFTCKFFCFGIEYKQALGLASGGMISPYALRFSFGMHFD